MTKKDYELIASAILEANADTINHSARSAGVHQTARRIASKLTKNNPKFDRRRFLTACGIKEV